MSLKASNDLIARGRTAEVFGLGPDRVLKLFADGTSPEVAAYEARVTQAAHLAGAGAPAVIEVVEHQGRPGILYQRVNGASMLEMLAWRSGSALEADAGEMARLHLAIHKAPTEKAGGLPVQRDRLHKKIERAPRLGVLRVRVLELLRSLPDDRVICHGDFHPGNIIITDTGPRVIDWVDASLGHPLADVAQTFLLGETYRRSLTNETERARIEGFLVAYRSSYLPNGAGDAEIDRWLPVVAAARLSEAIAGEEDELISMVDIGLLES